MRYARTWQSSSPPACPAVGLSPSLPPSSKRSRFPALPPLALKAQLLIYAGMSTTEALDKLGVDRTTRYRVRNQLSQLGDKPPGR
jgi:hypothetical protein